jgi:hypothetical protein
MDPIELKIDLHGTIVTLSYDPAMPPENGVWVNVDSPYALPVDRTVPIHDILNFARDVEKDIIRRSV